MHPAPREIIDESFPIRTSGNNGNNNNLMYPHRLLQRAEAFGTF